MKAHRHSLRRRPNRPRLLRRVRLLHPRPLRVLRPARLLRPRSSDRIFSSSDGGTGRRARLRGVWGNPCEFDSRSEHLYPQVRSNGFNRLRWSRIFFVHILSILPWRTFVPARAPGRTMSACCANSDATACSAARATVIGYEHPTWLRHQRFSTARTFATGSSNVRYCSRHSSSVSSRLPSYY
jgi:hypothetical protein